MRDKIINWVGYFVFFAAVLILSQSFGYDDSDNKKTGDRSGVSITTDYLTGCQYLKPLFGGITPRMYPNGEQVCIQVGESGTD